MLCCHLQHTSPRNIKPVKPPRASRRNRQQFSTFVQRTTLALDPCYALYCSRVAPVKLVHQVGFQLQSPESMVLEHSPSRFIPEDHYEKVTWNNFNLATELPRIPTPVVTSEQSTSADSVPEQPKAETLPPPAEVKTSDQTVPEYGRHKGVFKGGGFRGFNPPPPKFSDFFEK